MSSSHANPIETLDSAAIDASTIILEIDDLSFPVLDYGDGSVVLLLHGFPDSRYVWRYQVPVLAAAGFRVIAPDLRGFGDASKPKAVDAYRMSTVVDDIIDLLDRMGISDVRLVGHDWGAAVAWLLTARHPDRIERLVALSIGAPGTSGYESLEQRERSWYFYFFQFEGVAEAWLRHDDWTLFRDWAREDGDIERYLDDLSRPGALTAALNWYRANVRPRPPRESGGGSLTVTCPVMGVWSDGDHYLTEESMTASTETVAGPWRYEKLTDASHWLMLDKPTEVNDLLIEFLSDDGQ